MNVSKIDFHEEAEAEMIEVNPKIMLGKPVIRGTRITVELILRKLSEGATEATLLKVFPNLTKEGISASKAYALRKERYIKAVRQGMEDCRNGKTISHEDLVAELESRLRNLESTSGEEGAREAHRHS